jgi:adenylylsulfate kinase
MKQGDNPAPRTVCLDFDGVLADYHGWKDKDTLDPPYPGAKEFVERVLAAGYAVVVHTTRHPIRIESWLHEHGFPFIEVHSRKPKALVYIDDRGFRFTGNWDAAFEAIRQPAHWEKET